MTSPNDVAALVEPIAWRWRYVYPHGRNGPWYHAGEPRYARPAQDDCAAVEVEPLFPATTIAALQAEVERAKEGMANVIVQADCLRHYAVMTDGTKAAPLPTTGELQAGHFEDIAVRTFPDLMPLLEEKRAARSASRKEPTP